MVNQMVEELGYSAQSIAQETGHAHEIFRKELRAVGLYTYELELLDCTDFGSLCTKLKGSRSVLF